MRSFFDLNKYTETLTYFDGWALPEDDKKIIIDLAEEDAGCFDFTECIYERGSKLFVDSAIDYIIEAEENENELHKKALNILKEAFKNGIDIITFYR
jgi:hypothetical protein